MYIRCILFMLYEVLFSSITLFIFRNPSLPLSRLIRKSYQNIVSLVEAGKAKSDSLPTYFITTCNVRIARSMFHAETTGVFQRFDYL